MRTGIVKDMTRGKIPGLLLSFSAPMLAGNLFQQFYNMTDSIIVGNYVGPNALGAVGACNSLNFFFFALCSGLSLGIGVVMAQQFGAGSREAVQKTIANGSYVILAASVVMGIIGFTFAEPVLSFMQTPPEYIGDSIRYFKIVSLGMTAVAAYNGASAMLRSLGDSQTPLLFLILASAVNIVLDLIFVLYFHMGVAGVAAATVIAQGISAAGCIVFAVKKNPYFKLNRKLWKPDQTVIWQCIRMGIPVGLQNAMISLSGIALQSVANGFGSQVATAYTMTVRLEQLIQQPYNSLAAGVSTFTGQNMGAGKTERVRKGLKTSMIICAVFSLFMLALMQLAGAGIMRIFGSDREILSIAQTAIRITSFFYFPLGVIYLIRGLSNGAGDAAYSMINGIVEVFCRVGFSLILTGINGIGMWGVWLTTGFTWSVTAIASILRYKQKKWMNKTVLIQSESSGGTLKDSSQFPYENNG